jgi:hypothetical protein
MGPQWPALQEVSGRHSQPCCVRSPPKNEARAYASAALLLSLGAACVRQEDAGQSVGGTHGWSMARAQMLDDRNSIDFLLMLSAGLTHRASIAVVAQHT